MASKNSVLECKPATKSNKEEEMFMIPKITTSTIAFLQETHLKRDWVGQI